MFSWSSTMAYEYQRNALVDRKMLARARLVKTPRNLSVDPVRIEPLPIRFC